MRMLTAYTETIHHSSFLLRMTTVLSIAKSTSLFSCILYTTSSIHMYRISVQASRLLVPSSGARTHHLTLAVLSTCLMFLLCAWPFFIPMSHQEGHSLKPCTEQYHGKECFVLSHNERLMCGSHSYLEIGHWAHSLTCCPSPWAQSMAHAPSH